MSTAPATPAADLTLARLRELHRWLRLEGLTGFLLLFGLVLPASLVGAVLVGAAALFTPYLLLRLGQVERRGWMVGFGVCVLIPATAALLWTPSGVLGSYLLWIVPLIAFYAYTWLLQHAVGEWLREREWQMEYESG